MWASRLTLSATSDPIVASTLADPQYITEVAVTGNVVLTVFLGAAWNKGSVLTGYVCTGASVWVFTGEALVISDLVVGTPSGFSVPLVLRQVFSPFSTASQIVTAKAPPLPPVFLCISLQDQTVVVEVASIPANASFAYTTSIVCGASFQQSASVSQFMPWMFVEGLQQAKNARSARCYKCLSAGVYGFSLVQPWFPRKSKSEIGGRTFAQQCADDSLVHGAF